VFSLSGASEIVAAGRYTYDEDSPVVTPETVYDLASVTKVIPTAALAARFIAANKIGLGDAITFHIPELQNDYGATIEDLLRYRVKGPRLATLEFATFEEIRTHLFENGFDGPPGQPAYSNLPSYLLGVLLERAGKGSLAALAHHHFFKPLSMERTTFFPAKDECVPTEIQGERVIQGIVHDESARKFALRRRSVGHAGLFSTAIDLMKCAEALLSGDMPEVFEAAEQGLGWSVHENFFMGEAVSKRAFGKTGFTGTSIVVDPEKKLALVLLANRTFPERPSDATSKDSEINRLRRTLAEAVF
jgi:CubicO group peptidase (beta-lactamase class C family)